MLAVADLERQLTAVPDPFRAVLMAVIPVWSRNLGDRLVSLVLFGSVARGTATASSDIDMMIVAHGFPNVPSERRRPLLAEWQHVRARGGLPAVEWNLVTKTHDEARHRSPLYLDMVEDALLLFDRDRFFEGVLDGMRARMRELGSRRVFLKDGSWYWDLKPDFRWGDVVEI